MISLDTYLDAVLAEPWAWGRMDCCAFAANWILSRTERDPLGKHRGYSTSVGARRIIALHGSLLSLVDHEMARCGFRRTEVPEHGDIGLVELPEAAAGGPMSVAKASVVILHATRWIGRAEQGIFGAEAAPIAMWHVA